jgi:hypothetical protein
MNRGFGYAKTDRPDCLTCYQCITDCARGNLCGYDEEPVSRGYRCGLYIEKSKPVESGTDKQAELF